MKEIFLENKKLVAMVDDADYEYLNQWKWNAGLNSKNGKYYARRTVRGDNGKCYPIFMHRLLLGLGRGDKQWVDHKNNDGLDNRKDNLRKCSPSENNMNRGLQSQNKSGYKGIDWRPDLNKWRVRIKVDRKEMHLGVFSALEEALQVRRDAALKYHGDFARFE